MDEPFGALDPITRVELQREFLALQGRLHKTVVFVTHDLREALLLGTRIALMETGSLVSVNTPQEFVDSTEPLVAAYVAAFGTPEIPKRAAPKPREKLEIRQRLSETHYLPISMPAPKPRPAAAKETLPDRDGINRNLARLYRLALEMGGAETQDALVNLVLNGLDFHGAIPESRVLLNDDAHHSVVVFDDLIGQVREANHTLHHAVPHLSP